MSPLQGTVFSGAHSYQPHSFTRYLGDISDWTAVYYNTLIPQLIIICERVATLAYHLTREEQAGYSLGAEQSRTKHDAIERIMTLAKEMRPEATLLIGWSEYALQHQTCLFIRADGSNSTWA
jgi:hypothetical protein